MAQNFNDVDDDYTSRNDLDLYSYDANAESPEWTKLALPHNSGVAVPSMIRVVSWNVDFMASYSEHRVRCILDHLQNTVIQETEIATSPPILLLQEVEDDALQAILEHTWIRNNFNVSPISREDWTSSYGSVTLVHKSIPVSKVFKINFEKSVMGRFALLVDLKLGNPAALTGVGHDAADESGGGKQETVPFRLASVHLESLPEVRVLVPGSFARWHRR